MGLFPVHGKKQLLRKKKKKNGTDQHDEDHGEGTYNWSLGMYDHCTGGLHIGNTRYIYSKIAITIAVIQETRWNKLAPQTFTSNGYNIYTSSLANNHEFGRAFLVDQRASLRN
jgi:hypothetical protein